MAAREMDPALWNVVLQFQQGGDLNGVPTQLSVVYSLYGQDGSMLAQEVRPVDNPQVVVDGNGGQSAGGCRGRQQRRAGAWRRR